MDTIDIIVKLIMTLSVFVIISFLGIKVYRHSQHPDAEKCARLSAFDETRMVLRHDEMISNLIQRVNDIEKKVK